RPAKALALGVDTDHPPRLDALGAQELVHQVGADVARTDDGRCRTLLVHSSPHSNVRLTSPSTAPAWLNVALNSSPGPASMARVHDPGRITLPARSRTPKPATLRASHATAMTGSPSTASERPSATCSPLRTSTASIAFRSTSSGVSRALPRQKPAEEAL